MATSALLASCQGVVSDLPRSRGEVGGSSSDTGGTGTGGGAGAVGDLLPARIRRLTNEEYDRSVQSLLATQKAPGQAFVPDTRQAGFTVNAAQVVDPVLAGQLEAAAQDLAHEAVTSNLSTLLPCATGGAGAACASTFISSFGAKAYRRPLSADETADLMAAYTLGADGATFADGIELVITSVLQSAGFLYVTEIGDDPNTSAVTLSPYEIASELSYLFLGAPPDADLAAAAAAGTLLDPAVREQEARRLLRGDDVRVKSQIARAVKEWLGIDKLEATDKDSTVYKNFQTLRPAMLDESESFVEEVMFGANGTKTLGELLTADYTMASPGLAANLATFYGAPAPAGGRISLTSAPRRGILHQGAFLSVFGHNTESAPVLRGVAVLRRLSCVNMPAPTNLKVAIVPPPPDPKSSTRERYAIHAADPACAQCHNQIDAIGFTFENFDGEGGLKLDPSTGQLVDNNQPVDTKTVLAAGTDIDGSYADSLGLVAKLGDAESVRSCFARNLFRFASAQSQDEVETAFLNVWNALPSAAHGSLIEALVAYAKSPSFVQRSVQP